MAKKIKILIYLMIIFILGLVSMKHFNIGIPCIYYELSRLYCPGCGMTRAVFSLLQLDFYQAFRYNAFSILIIPLIGLYIIGDIYAWLFNKTNFVYEKMPSAIWVILVVLMLLYGVLRNIPQFSFLAPTVL